MKKLTEKEKAQLTDEEREVHFDHSMLRWARNLVVLKNAYQYFIKNKGWILSLLFVLSIVRSSIWYACFGVNILTYSNLQDIFISFADYFMSIIIIEILLIWLYLFIPRNIDNKWEKIIGAFFLIIFLLVILWIIFSLYRMLFSILVFISICLTLYSYWASKKKIALLYFSLFWLFALSLFQPMEQYLYVRPRNYKEREKKSPGVTFMEKSAHYDYISFDYGDTHIDTKTNTYYLIGYNSSYYFVLDKGVQETLIIPIGECKNIKSHPFGLQNLLFLH